MIGSPKNIFEISLIVYSQIHLGVQIADVVAYALRRYVFKILKRNLEAFINKYCERILER
ncbi:MAG: hypothetical protein P8Y70_17910 [Candidatus Lokiarchaeota archaeon]